MRLCLRDAQARNAGPIRGAPGSETGAHARDAGPTAGSATAEGARLIRLAKTGEQPCACQFAGSRPGAGRTPRQIAPPRGHPGLSLEIVLGLTS